MKINECDGYYPDFDEPESVYNDIVYTDEAMFYFYHGGDIQEIVSGASFLKMELHRNRKSSILFTTKKVRFYE